MLNKLLYILKKKESLVAGVACAFLVLVAMSSNNDIIGLGVGLIGGVAINETIGYLTK